jgi:ubiquinone/menaquinone biosynthesis C-methylase UbiE
MTQDCWDEDYRKKGRLYGGSPRELPAFPAGARVLEMGCGDGKTLSALVHRGLDITAIDFSPIAVTLARERTRQGSGVALAVADAREIPFRNRSFDAVVAIHVLGHSTAVGRGLIAREICRVIRPGGRIFFCDFSIRDFRSGSGTEKEPGTVVRGNGVLTHYFTEREVTDLFSGLVMESSKTEEWVLRVRGKDHLRSEIAALFRKQAGPS